MEVQDEITKKRKRESEDATEKGAKEDDPVPLTQEEEAKDDQIVQDLCGYTDAVQTGELEDSNEETLDDASEDEAVEG